jgi:acid phosphatase type 7
MVRSNSTNHLGAALPVAVMVIAILSLGVTIFATENTASAETTSATSTADASILENAPTTNYGGATTLGADGDEAGQVLSGSGMDKYGLLRWDLAGIAPGTKISSASVTLTVTNSSPQTYEAYALKRTWAESQVTWNSYAAGGLWEVAGAKGPLDREATVAGTITPSTTGERTFAVSTAVVQRWVDNPATNHGIIVADTTNSDGFDFYSRESTTSSQRPRLTVNVEGGVDTTPPETTIDSGSSGTVTSTSANFTFSSNEANSTFECRLDGAAFTSCTSPKGYNSLANGSHTFEVRATDAAGNTDSTPASHTWIVDTTSTQNDPVLVGAGDIARCSSISGAEATAKLLDGISGTVFTTGDNAYESGTLSEFNNCYDPTWGRYKARTKPTPGNHEYGTQGASGYFNYFGAAAGDPSKGYYSYNLGEWHVISLNSMCENVGGCGESSPMVSWLEQDLAANSEKACTLAYFHHPLFNSGTHGNATKMRPTWDALYAANAEVVLNGHDHHYERFAPQSPSGTLDTARGIREFVVGTGGASHYGITNVQPNSEVRNSDTFGVLKLTLHPTSYDWNFVPEAGKTFTDSGTTSCH